MASFTKNPLFRLASRTVQKNARREWNKTDAAKSVRQIQQAARGGTSMAGGASVRKALDQWGKSGFSDVVRTTLLSSDFGTMISEVEKYARVGGHAGRLVSQFLGQIGPIGSLIRSVLSSGKRGGGLQGDIQSAVDFLDAVAPETLSSRGRKRSTAHKPAAKRSANEVAEQIEAAKKFLEGQGFEVKEPSATETITPGASPSGKEKTYPGGIAKTTKKGQPRKVVDIDVEGGRKRFPVSHPIVTKRMVLTSGSSNVHSYSYDVDTRTLYIRFLSSVSPGAPGSLYGYSNVPPKTFLRMHDAPSKGTFVWDYIRIRGTVSGHKYDYQLVSVRDNYVPRKATMTAAGEMFVPRTVRVKRVSTGKIRVLKSGGEMRPGPHHYR